MFALRYDGVRILLPAGRSLIGRADDCLVRVADRAVLAHHAVLVRTIDGLFVEAAGDGAEVRVNGAIIRGPHTLRVGDRVEVGGAQILVELDRQIAEPSRKAGLQASTAIGTGARSARRDVVPGLLAAGMVAEAANIMAVDLAAIEASAAQGRTVSPEDLQKTARSALDLARQSGDPRWLEGIYRVYMAHRVPIPVSVVQVALTLLAGLPAAPPDLATRFRATVRG